MALLPQSYQLFRVFPSLPQQCEIKSCVVYTSPTHQIISCIRDDIINNSTTTNLLISFQSTKYNFEQTLSLNEIHNSTNSYCSIDQHGQDIIVLYSDFTYFSYTCMRNNFTTPTLRSIKLIKTNKLPSITCFTLISHFGLPIGVFGTSNGSIGFFNVNTGVLVKTMSISKRSIDSMKLCNSLLFIQTGNKIYYIKIIEDDEIVFELPIEFGSCDSFYVNSGQIGINFNNKLQLLNIGTKGLILFKEIDFNNRVFSKGTCITACAISDLVFILDTKYLTVTYNNNVLFGEKLITKPKGIIPYQLPNSNGMRVLEGIIVWDENDIVLCQSVESLEHLIVDQLLKEDDKEKQDKICGILRGYGSSKETIIEMGKILMEEHPMKAHKLLETFNILCFPIYRYIFIHHRFQLNEYDILLESMDKHADENTQTADLMISIFIAKDYYYGLSADAAFIKYLNQRVLYDRTKAMKQLAKHAKLFWRYILELLLLCELKVVEAYCQTITKLSMNIVEPQLFISSLIKNVPKCIFSILSTPPLYDALPISQKFDMLCKAIKLSPSLSHIIELESLLCFLKPQQLELLTQLIKPKTLTFSCISMINDYAKNDLYDLYVKAVLLQELPIICGDSNKFSELINSLVDPLFDFGRTYQFLVLNNYIIESATLLCFYKRYENALEFLFDRIEEAPNCEDILNFIVERILNGIDEKELIGVIECNERINIILLNYLFNKEEFYNYLTPNLITAIEINYFKKIKQDECINAEHQLCLDKIIPGIDGTAQRLLTNTKVSSEIMIFCPKKHKYTIHSLKQKAKITSKLEPNNPVIIEMNELLNTFLKDNENMNNKLICPLCVKSVLSKEETIEKDDKKTN